MPIDMNGVVPGLSETKGEPKAAEPETAPHPTAHHAAHAHVHAAHPPKPQPPTTTRCLLHCDSIEHHARGTVAAKLSAAYDASIPEEQRFCKSSPSGHFEIYIDNPETKHFFEPGKKYYFDVTAAPEPVVATAVAKAA